LERINVNSLTRIIQIYEQLRHDGEVNSTELAAKYNKGIETIKKDIRFIREALGPAAPDLRYDRLTKAYRMDKDGDPFIATYILLTMLYGNRSLRKEELDRLRNMLFGLLSDKERIQIRKITDSYDINYVPMIDSLIFDCIRDIFDCIQRQNAMRIDYMTSDLKEKSYTIAPLSIAFDEGFFYVFGNINLLSDQPAYRNFRIDRIQKYETTNETFRKNQHGDHIFRAGERLNQSFMMHSGDSLVNVTIRLEPWLSRYLISKFPIHTFLREENGKEIYQITVSDEKSLLFWLLPQRTWAEVLSPRSLRDQLKSTITDMARMYEII